MLNSDLNWLPTSIFKNLTIPKIIYEPYNYQNYGGYYTHGSNELVIVEDEEEESLIASRIAHELCHHIQYEQGRMPNVGYIFPEYDNYEEAIHNYFKYYIEYEALLFEHKHSKNYLNEWWLRKLVHEK